MFYNYQKFLIVKFLELYSFYSLRSVLVLIFAIYLGLNDNTAFLTYTNFVVGGDIISILGAYFGDKLLTRRISWLIGSVISIFGYSYSYFHFTVDSIPFGLIFAGMGLGLCRCNSNVIINNYIQAEIQQSDRHNHNGVFHVVTIITLFFGFVINGFILKYGHPKLVFIFSAISVLCGLIVFLSLEFKQLKIDIMHSLQGKLEKIFYVIGMLSVSFVFCKSLYIFKENIQVLILVCVCVSVIVLSNLSHDYKPREKQSVLSLLLYVPFYLLYLSFEKQLDMGFALFLFRNVNKNLFGYQIPSSVITAVFSISILFASFIFFKKSVYSYFKHHSTLIVGLFASFLFFLINYLGCILNHLGTVNILFPVISLVFLGIADVIIVPRMYSLCRNVPENIKSTAASLMMLSHGSGFYLAGKLAKLFTIENTTDMNLIKNISVYQTGFLDLICINLIILFAVFILIKTHYGALLIRK